MTPRQLFEWGAEIFKSLHFKYCTTNDHSIEETHLEERLKVSRIIPGTQKLHCFISLSNSIILTKKFSNSSVGKEEKVTLVSKDEIPVDEITGFIIAVYE